MSDVTGPISTLPGDRHHLPPGAMCDMHPSVPAVARIQGETDSFGCEMLDMCQKCLDEHREYLHEERDRLQTCDWCKAENVKVRKQRDYDEGMYGPVYRVCNDCIKKQNDAIDAELDRFAERYGYFD